MSIAQTQNTLALEPNAVSETAVAPRGTPPPLGPLPGHSPPGKWTFLGRHHIIGAGNDMSGPGANVPGLAASMDMSLFNYGWGGQQAEFNGAGITINKSYPFTHGSALTLNTRAGVRYEARNGHYGGFNLEFYGRAGDPVVGRVFGNELPFNDFKRINGALHAPNSALSFYHAYYFFKEQWGNGRLTLGTLHPERLPDLSRKETNYLRLGSLVYRNPVTNGSFWEKEDRVIETGRHPLYGANFLGEINLTPKRKVTYELLWGRNDPTPMSNVDRDVRGGRIGLPFGRFNIGLSHFRNSGQRLPAITDEKQQLYATDMSYTRPDGKAVYAALAHSDYQRGAADVGGSAWVLGVRAPLKKTGQVKLQYQRLGENYELMSQHKIEHYPTNWQGVNLDVRYPLNPRTRLGAAAYHLRQVRASDPDSIFGDSFFPSIPGSEKGIIRAYRLLAERSMRRPKETITAYLERAEFRKPGLAGAPGIHKNTTSAYVSYVRPIGKDVTLEAGYRIALAGGRWQAMRFAHTQHAPQLGIVWHKPGREEHVRVLYHRYRFNEEIAPRFNNWRANQLVLEIHIPH